MTHMTHSRRTGRVGASTLGCYNAPSIPLKAQGIIYSVKRR
jgi:hypothetical protein